MHGVVPTPAGVGAVRDLRSTIDWRTRTSTPGGARSGPCVHPMTLRPTTISYAIPAHGPAGSETRTPCRTNPSEACVAGARPERAAAGPPAVAVPAHAMVPAMSASAASAARVVLVRVMGEPPCRLRPADGFGGPS